MLERQPKTEAECESVFSHAKQILTKHRYSLKPENLSLAIRVKQGAKRHPVSGEEVKLQYFKNREEATASGSSIDQIHRAAKRARVGEQEEGGGGGDQG